VLRGGELPARKAGLGYFELKHGQQIERANSLLDDALDEQPVNPQILRLVGQADWFHRGDREAGRERVVKACIADPADVVALRMAADMCLVLGDATSAAYYYRKLMKRCTADWQIEANYGSDQDRAMDLSGRGVDMSCAAVAVSLLRLLPQLIMWLTSRYNHASV
jgi:hypothetical protein